MNCLVFLALPLLQTTGSDKNVPVTAPVVYEDLMLIISDDNSVIALIFDGEIDQTGEGGAKTERGVKYRYRCISDKNSKPARGSGVVAERIKTMKTADPRVIKGVDVGSVRRFGLGVGRPEVDWWYQGPGRGWIVYFPERVSVQIAHRDDFESIDLKRFRRNRR